MAITEFTMTDNAAVKGREDRYRVIRIDGGKALKSWKKSLYSFEWLRPDGAIRALDDLPLAERQKRLEMENSLKKGGPIERPVLGIGVLDNIEIGAGRAAFLTLVALGYKTIEVHIPKTNEDDFRPFHPS